LHQVIDERLQFVCVFLTVSVQMVETHRIRSANAQQHCSLNI